MTNAELIAKIKAEIERLKSSSNQLDYKNAVGFNWALDDVLSFLSDLEKSFPTKVSDGEGLEWEINRTYYEGSVADTSNIDHVTYENIAEHFYDLGCRRTAEKYDEIEYNRQRSEELPVALVAINPILPAVLKLLIATFKEQGGSSEIPKDLAPLIEAATIVYEAWNGGTMDDVRRGMVELGKRLKEVEK